MREQPQGQSFDMDGDAPERIAVVGMAGRFPGSPDLRRFWSNLREGVEGITFFSDEELRAAGVSEAELAAPGYVKAAPTLADVDLFDAGFFRMSRPEAEVTDPQHRLFMQCAWEALEDAGCVPSRVQGAVGVFAGSSLSGYLYFNLRHAYTFSEQGFQALIGNDKDYVASHTAYKLDLGGPAIGVQSACSTSLVAVHLACQSLLSHECDLAIAGGATVRVPRKRGYMHQEGGVFSPDGHCRPFDHRAAGTIFGSGVGAVALRRLEDAVAAGDRIYAVILGSAVNNDGARKVGFTAPGEDGQVRVISEALEVAGVDPADVGYVETHGTGTRLGDPIEVAALRRVFRGVTGTGRCALGAVKSNVGHLESAAGIVGLIKTVLALHHGEIPPTLHFEAPNPLIDFAGGPFYVNTELRPWPALGRLRRAGVSSFGIGGTNAHVVLEEAPSREPAEPPSDRLGEPLLLPISARGAEALRELAARYADRLRGARAAEEHWRLAAAAALRRSHHEHRLALVLQPGESAAAAPLDELLAGGTPRDAGSLGRGRVPPDGPPKVVFVFPGQGSQWVGMGRQLLASEPVFRRVLEECDAAIRRWTDWSLLSVLAAGEEESRLGELDVVQPTLFAIEVALAALWRSWGVQPAALIGHSMGEVAAACVAGALSLDDAALVICRRSRLALQVRGRGAMAVVELSAAAARDAIADCAGRVEIAARNSPRSTVLSGEAGILDEVLDRLERRGVFCRRVKVDFASHCSQVDPLLPELERILAGVRPAAGEIPIYSTVEGRLIDGSQLDSGYWVRNLRQPVLLADMVELARRDGHSVFLEVSPHPGLVTAVADCLAASPAGGAVALASLRREENERGALLATAAALYGRGIDLDWEALYPGGVDFVELPVYPWQRQRFWIAPADAAAPALSRRSGEHPLLGEPLVSSLHPGTRFWQCRREGLPPEGDGAQAAYLLELALSAAQRGDGPAASRLEEVTLDAGRAWAGDEVLQVALAPEAAGRTMFQIASALPDGPWTVLSRGRVATAPEPGAGGHVDLGALRERCAEAIDPEELYRERREAGLETAHRALAEIRRGDGEVLARLRLPEDGDGFLVHPALFDACYQALAAAVPSAAGGPIPYLPTGAAGLELQGRPGEELWACCALRPASAESRALPSARVLEGDVVLCDGHGRTVLRGEGLRARWPIEHWLYEVRWERAGEPEPAPGRAAGRWLLFQDRGGLGEALATALVEQGAEVVQVSADGAAPYAVDPSRPEDFRRLLEEVGPVTGMVYLWGLDAGPRTEEDAVFAERDAVLVCDGLLHLAQALSQIVGGTAPRLAVVSRGAVGWEGDPAGLPGLVQSPLWGLGAVIGGEHPELRCRVIDLGPGEPSGILAALAGELLSDSREDRVALRGGERRVARLVRHLAPPPALKALPVRGDATYLVTGGLGGLGLACARFLAENGARHLALLGRSAPSEEAVAVLAGLERAGADVRVLRADVSDRRSLEAALSGIGDMPPLRGVVHAAGVRDSGPVEESLLRRQTPERFRRVLAPKVAGSWNLHRLTRDRDLDFFLLFSSVATLFGSAGQAGYAAANSFLDALALHRRLQGLSGLAVSWGAWGEVGMAASAPDLEARLAYEGMASVSTADGLEALRRLLAEGPEGSAHVIVMPFRHALWRRFNPQASAAPLFAHQASAEEEADEEAAGDLRERVLAAPLAERPAVLERYLAERVAETLRVPQEQIDVEVPLNQLGLSSLLSLETRNRLERDLGIAIPIVQFLQSESLSQFAAQLAERLAVEHLLTNITAAAEPADSKEWDQLTL